MSDDLGFPRQKAEDYQLPELSFDSSPLSILSTPSMARRPAYQRVSSLGSYEGDTSRNTTYDVRTLSYDNSMRTAGLAISNVPFSGQHGIHGTKRTTKDAADPFSSPPAIDIVDDYDAVDVSEGNSRHTRNTSGASLASSNQAFLSVPETDGLLARGSMSSKASYNPFVHDNLGLACKSKRNILLPRKHWLSITIVLLSVYSTALSFAWLIIAVVKPRYGYRINTTPGSLSPNNASTLTAIFAKSIELSFVTVFVAFLGQVLTRRAFSFKSQGMSIADMSARSWVIQPGTLITQWNRIRYSGGTVLGIISLLAALVPIFYTTASDTLDAPKLKLGKLEELNLYGRVATSWANLTYVKDTCQTPITSLMDPLYNEDTCLVIEFAGQGFTNIQQYMGEWVTYSNSGIKSQDLGHRPLPTALLYDNTTIQGSWINILNMTEVSQNYSRIINNVTMAMPHTGVVAAASDPINHIMQPQDFDGLGQFYLGASLPSPSVNVLCVGMTKEELSPLVYTTWPAAKEKPLDPSTWPTGYDIFHINDTHGKPDWGNATVVDDIFGFGQKYNRRPPVFAKFPIRHNIILNSTTNWVDALYILATSPTNDFMLCSLSASLSTNCSTWYNASISGGSMASHCEDQSDALQYSKRLPNATNGIRSNDWVDVATDWASGVDLNGGISDANDSISRLLTELIPTSYTLNPKLPSIAEALAVLTGCTLIVSSIGAPFVHFYNYTEPIWNNPQPQYFPVALSYQDYASGGDQPWQNIFYLVLLLAFLLNVLCLVYFLFNGGLVNDFLEPQNLFALAINSPASQRLAGSCGGGPEGDQLQVKWSIRLDEDTEHVSIIEKNIRHEPMYTSPPEGKRFSYPGSPISESYSRLSRKRTSIM